MKTSSEIVICPLSASDSALVGRNNFLPKKGLCDFQKCIGITERSELVPEMFFVFYRKFEACLFATVVIVSRLFNQRWHL